MPHTLEDYPVVPETLKRDQKSKPWIMEAPVISMAHFPEQDLELMSDLTMSGPAKEVTKLDSGPSYLVDISDHDTLTYFSSRARHVFKSFADRGYRWLRADPDGTLITELPTYD
jgi:hypothetical protein